MLQCFGTMKKLKNYKKYNKIMTLENPICNTIFDTRDLIEYIEFETSEVLEEYTELSGREADTIDEIDICDKLDREYDFTERLDNLQRVVDFAEELEGYGDYEYGESVIHEDYFTEYTEVSKRVGYNARIIAEKVNNKWDVYPLPF